MSVCVCYSHKSVPYLETCFYQIPPCQLPQRAVLNFNRWGCMPCNEDVHFLYQINASVNIGIVWLYQIPPFTKEKQSRCLFFSYKSLHFYNVHCHTAIVLIELSITLLALEFQLLMECTSNKHSFALFLIWLVFCSPLICSQLSYDFYDATCPGLTPFVQTYLRKAMFFEPRIAASLLRLHFHDCFANVNTLSLVLLVIVLTWSWSLSFPNHNELWSIWLIRLTPCCLVFFSFSFLSFNLWLHRDVMDPCYLMIQAILRERKMQVLIEIQSEDLSLLTQSNPK